jgi:uncharacterized damage-inducible protein DinB
MATSNKQHFLDSLDTEHATTMRVLKAFPRDKLDLRPHGRCKNARELAWVFVAERGMSDMVMTGKFPEGMQGEMPAPPESWDDLLDTVVQANLGFRAAVEAIPDEALGGTVRFFTAPHTISEIPLKDFLWLMLHDEIHHRGQFSVYLRMADGKVPSIYGPSADEPWM